MKCFKNLTCAFKPKLKVWGTELKTKSASKGFTRKSELNILGKR